MNTLLDNGLIIRAEIMKQISIAESSIKIAMAYFTDKEIFDQLIKANNRGVDIKIILADEETNKKIIENGSDKISSNFKFYKKVISGRGIMHHKFCIIDSKIILKGSYNYTLNASLNNDESLEISTDNQLIIEYERVFSNLILESTEINHINNDIPMSTIYNNEDIGLNEIDNFSMTLQRLASDLIDKFDIGEITKEGFLISEKNQGDPDQFKTSLDIILNKYKIDLGRDDQSRKLIKNRIESASADKISQLNLIYESNKNNITKEYETLKDEVNLLIKQDKKIKDENEFEKNKKESELASLKSKKSLILESINKLITKIGVTQFKFSNTWYNFLFLSFLFIYLFIFYSSAIYNLLYVAKEADRASQLGFTSSISSVEFFNSQALSKILASNFSNILFCFIGVLIPLGLSITKVFNKNKVVIFILSWILAVIVVDFFVALSISKTISKVESIRVGSDDPWVFSSSFQDLEFWKVFIFGAIPLIMFKLNAELIYSKWRTSQPDLMDKDRSIEIKLLKQECIQLDEDIYKLNYLVEYLANKITNNNQIR